MSLDIDATGPTVTEQLDLAIRGYLAGYYSARICGACGGKFTGDKHAWKCEPCATKEAKDGEA